MRSIGFKNFRKFKEFPPIALSPITILVGENNAGKSTVVKGILAVSDFLKSSQGNMSVFRRESDRRKRMKEFLKGRKFYFNASYLAHIGTFKRALYNKSDEGSISFHACLQNNMDVEIEVLGNKDDNEATYGNVSKITIKYINYNITVCFKLLEDIAELTFSPSSDIDASLVGINNYNTRDRLRKYHEVCRAAVSFSMPLSDYIYRPNFDLIGTLLSAVESAIDYTISYDENKKPTYPMWLFDEGEKEKLKPIKIGEETRSFLKQYISCLNPMGRDEEDAHFKLPGSSFFMHWMPEIEYLYAHAVTQTIIYSAKDTNDYLSRTIHEFSSDKSVKYKHDFIVKWMQEFGIGKDYAINSVGGEAHLVKIINADGECVNLADKGMGSIQLMVLLFRLAISLPESGRHGSVPGRRGTIVIVEEPEQNLHPMLQSKLADLFYELHATYGFRFIIETHSEYLVRRSQVIVGERYKTQEELGAKNPFKVYYFPSEGVPYDMKYSLGGMFEKKFGDGFMNEAGKLHMAVLSNLKGKN